MKEVKNETEDKKIKKQNSNSTEKKKTTKPKTTSNKKSTTTKSKTTSTSKKNVSTKSKTSSNSKKNTSTKTKTTSTSKKTTTTKPKSKPSAKSKVATKTNVTKKQPQPKTDIATKVETKKETKKVVDYDLKELENELKKDIKEKKSSPKKIIFLIIILILLIIAFISLHLITPKIEINGKSEIEIPYGTAYIEKGAKAKYFGADLTKKIKITNNINIDKIGTYEVIYEVKNNIYNIKKVRTVNVVDKIKPTITLKGEKEVDVCPNKNFKEIGYTATDEYDGDLTHKVNVTTKGDKVIYSVEDSSGNSFSTTRKINKIDRTKPNITLKGNSTVYLTPDQIFSEPGYTATDNCTSDLTNRVVVTGNVKSKQKGTYTLTYEVTDDSNNKTTIKRKVIISDRTNPNSGTYSKGTIYLTFDDGPSSVTTGTILDILKEENVKATFFVTNKGPDYLIKRMYDEGHTVALHTASHNYAQIYSSTDNYFNDLEQVSNRVKRITGQTSKIVRFPGGASNTVSRKYNKGIMTRLSNELFNRGYRYYDWNVDSMDASTAKTKDDVYKNVTRRLSKDRMNIVLMHDIKIPTRDALRAIINYGKENGYTFDRIDMDTYMIRQSINN